MSSHREAPEISKDPVADSTDLYAFVSPDKPDTVTIIANYIPLEPPASGPNFFEFGDDVTYYLYVDNDGDGKPEITYSFVFTTMIRDKNTFLYNTGQIKSLGDSHWNRPQKYSVFRQEGSGKPKRIGQGLACPPCYVGERSCPDYEALASAAIHKLPSGETVFAGQRRDGFYVDLGAAFDLLVLRPFEHLHLLATPDATGVDSLTQVNVHSIALQVPIASLTKNKKKPSSSTDSNAVIGVWTAAARQKSAIREANGKISHAGPKMQVSRLGNPLINEVVIPMSEKDYWNAAHPHGDKQFASHYAHPEVQGLLTFLYPNVFPHLAKYTKPRVDLEAILLTGIPTGIISPTYTTYTGPNQGDMLRLNTGISPSNNPSHYGILGGDIAGFPNGRRVSDDVVTIELRCIAGASIPLVDGTYSADGAATAIFDVQPPPSNRYISNFPYLATPLSGFDVPS